MTITWMQMLLYAGGLVVLVATPGPVVVALVARSVSAGFRSSLALSAGVIVGDLFYPLLAIFGLAVIAEHWADFLTALRYMGAGILIWMGWRLIAGRAEGVDPRGRRVRRRGVRQSFLAGLFVNLGNPKSVVFFMGLLPGFFDIARLTPLDVAVIVGRAEGVDPRGRKVRRRGVWQSFLAGLFVNLGNPKSVVFFMGLLPGFFDVARLTPLDVAVIVGMSGLVPFLGNLVWAGLAARAGRLLASEAAVRRVNLGAGGVLAGAGVAIAAR